MRFAPYDVLALQRIALLRRRLPFALVCSCLPITSNTFYSLVLFEVQGDLRIGRWARRDGRGGKRRVTLRRGTVLLLVGAKSVLAGTSLASTRSVAKTRVGSCGGGRRASDV